MKAGDMVRVVSPTSPYLGTTGHVVGRSEQREDRWMIRLTTIGLTVLLVESDVVVVTAASRSPRGQRESDPTLG
jgi:hypothetical protein